MIDWDAAVLGPLANVFGEPATYAPAAQGAASFSIVGVFDRAYRDLTIIEADPGINAVEPVLGVRLAAFPSAPVTGDQVTVASVGLTFFVREVRPDGHGYAKLMLKRKTP